MIYRFVLAALLSILVSGPVTAQKCSHAPISHIPPQPPKIVSAPPSGSPGPPLVPPPQPQPSAAPRSENQQWLVFDTTEFELVERAAARKTTQLKIPVRIDATDVHILGWRVNQLGRPLDPSAVRFELQRGDGRYGTLLATFDLSQLQDAGPYAANVDFSGVLKTPTPTPAASPLPVSVAATTPSPPPAEQTVQFKITKPAAELRISTPLKIERIVYVPWWSSDLTPKTLTLNENAGKAWLSANPATWRVVLRKGEDTPETNALIVTLPQTIDGWGQAEAKLALEGDIGIGTTSGTLTVRSPQLATHTADFAITMVSRFATFWILVIIAIGIFFGWIFRNRLERKRARLEATIPAENEIASLDGLIDKSSDQAVKRGLQSAKDGLTKVLDNEGSTPEAIKTAITAAATERQRIVKELDEHTNAAQKKLQAWEWATATLPIPIPEDVRKTTVELNGKVKDWRKALDRGQIGDVEDAISTLPNQAQSISSAIKRSLDAITGTTIRPWVDAPALAALTKIKADATELRTTLNAEISPELLHSASVTTANLLADVRTNLFERGAVEAKGVAERIREDVVKRWPQLESEVAAVNTALKQIPEPAIAETRSGVQTLGTQLDKLWNAVHNLLSAAWTSEKQPLPLPGLDEGHFVEALGTVLALGKPKEDRLLGSKRSVAPGGLEENPLASKQAGPLPSGPPHISPTWTMTLEAAVVMLDQPTAVQIHVVSPRGQPAPQLRIEWFRDGQLEELSAEGVLRREFIFTRPGRAIIEAHGVDREGMRVTARLIVNVPQPHGTATLTRHQKLLSKIENAQTLIAGAIITGAGWIMFSPSFVGTVQEFFAAFLWGFTVDVGANKLIELSKSLPERKLTL